MFTYVALLFKILYGSELTGHMSGFVCQLLLTLLVSHFMLRLLIQYIHLQVSKICSHIYNNISKKNIRKGKDYENKIVLSQYSCKYYYIRSWCLYSLWCSNPSDVISKCLLTLAATVLSFSIP